MTRVGVVLRKAVASRYPTLWQRAPKGRAPRVGLGEDGVAQGDDGAAGGGVEDFDEGYQHGVDAGGEAEVAA